MNIKEKQEETLKKMKLQKEINEWQKEIFGKYHIKRC